MSACCTAGSRRGHALHISGNLSIGIRLPDLRRSQAKAASPPKPGVESPTTGPYNAPVARVVAVANQKGGVAKTTTVHTLGVALARRGVRVLLVDLDPQACLTFATGLDPDELGATLHDVLLGRTGAGDVVQPLGELSLLPSSIDLAGAELNLLGRTGREHVLRQALRPITDDFDVVLVDCAPSLGVLTVNGLTAADEVLVPMQCEALSHRGVAQLLDTIDDVREFTNHRLTVRGAVATMFDARTRHAREVLDDVRDRFGLRVLDPPIPKSVRFAEAPGRGISILDHAPGSRGAEAYEQIAATLQVEWNGGIDLSDDASPPSALDDHTIALDDLADEPGVESRRVQRIDG
jgi:chromosome partitioning protein